MDNVVLEKYLVNSFPTLPVYLINKKDQHKRLESSLDELKKLELSIIHRVDAVDASFAQKHMYSFFSYQVYKNITRGPTNTTIIPTWSAGACAISHLKAWELALIEEEEIIIICEDDIIVKSPEMCKFFLLFVKNYLIENPLSIWFFNGTTKYVSSYAFNYDYQSYSSIFGVDAKSSYTRLYNNTEFCIIYSHFYMTTKTALKTMVEKFYPIEYQIDIHLRYIQTVL